MLEIYLNMLEIYNNEELSDREKLERIYDYLKRTYEELENENEDN